jgi:hypothetical protein
MILGILSFAIPVLLSIPAIILGILGLKDINESRRRLIGGGMAITGIITGAVSSVVVPLLLIFVLLPAVQRVREAAQSVEESAAKAMSRNNLMQLGLAFHNYNDTYTNLPQAATYSRQGKPLLSWRVEILPFIEQKPLYDQFKRDEPWDSPHNIKLLPKMPKVYASPRGANPAESNATFYQVFVGPEAPFDPPDTPSTRLRSINIPRSFPDGLSQTILIAEAGEAVPWTKPADMLYRSNGPLPKLGGLFRDGFHVVMADGSPHWVDTRRVSETTLRAAITPAGGEIMGPDW